MHALTRIRTPGSLTPNATPNAATLLPKHALPSPQKRCRLGYDDFNESLTCRDVVAGALADLRVSPGDVAVAGLNDAYQSLTNLGFRAKGGHIDHKFDPQVGQ